MKIKDYLAIKNWKIRTAKEVKEEMLSNKIPPLEIENLLPEVMDKLLEKQGVSPKEIKQLDEYFDNREVKKELLRNAELKVNGDDVEIDFDEAILKDEEI